MDDARKPPEILYRSDAHEIGNTLREQPGAMQALLLTADEAEMLRRAIGVAWGEGEIEDSEAAVLYAAVTRATRP